MNKKLKILSKRVELASNAIVGSVMTGAVALVYENGKIVFVHATLATVLLVFGVVVYSAATWFLMELEVKGSEEGEDEDDG